ncbi:hypothetical protein [Nonomuraea roseola]|uniref:Uncharacterized protein n=1 Tax=Nonomuraea roseola TaxID=46179 RepID=A0ABV5QD40_9ACTN
MAATVAAAASARWIHDMVPPPFLGTGSLPARSAATKPSEPVRP